MTLSRREIPSGGAGRVNQRARTRAALVSAAVELVREGRLPSVPDAAERALVSNATAYRYFPSAEQLWEEAAVEVVEMITAGERVEAAIEAAGPDAAARLEAAVTTIGFRIIDDPLPFRSIVRFTYDHWLDEQQRHPDESVPRRPRRRHGWNEMVVEPLRGSLRDEDVDRLVAALDVAWGIEAAVALLDVAGLDRDAAKATMLQTCHWVLRGALADAGHVPKRAPSRPPRRRRPTA